MQVIRYILNTTADKPSRELYLEILSFLGQYGDRSSFLDLLKHTIGLLKIEVDLIDVLEICREYYIFLDLNDQEEAVQKIIDSRAKKKADASVKPKDRDIKALLKLLEQHPMAPSR